MKSMIKNLLLLTMVFSVYSCNEKISAELESGNSTTVPPVVNPSEYYFKVTNQSPVVLNYVLHRTGAGHASTACKVSSTIPFSSDLYSGEGSASHDSKVFDISCYLEAEELSLYFNGLEFAMEASKNTCDYVAYTPFGFFDAIVGSSSASYSGVTCDSDGGINSGDAAPFATANLAVYGAGSTPVNCGFMVDTGLPVAQRVPRVIPEDKQLLCAYDYATNGGGNAQNCDLGRISFNIVDVYNSETDPAAAKIPAARPAAMAPHSCGGTAAACVGGAIKHVDGMENKVFGVQVLNTNLNEDFSQSYSLPAAIGIKSNSRHITNFRRGLASMNLNYLDYSTMNAAQWADSTYNREFDPNLMERYAANLNPDGTVIIDTYGIPATALNATVSNATYNAKVYQNGWTNKPYTAEPYLGINGLRVNPFYTFHCLDYAQETKARIRMVVRDWDRIFSSTSSDKELISDMYKSIAARRIDLPSDELEVPGDPNVFNYYDDYDDWDVLIPMTRADPGGLGVYDPGDTTWQPTSGWWDTANYPNTGPFTAD